MQSFWIVAFFITLVPTGKAFAFGAEGHEAVCEIGYRELTPSAKKQVDRIMLVETNSDFRTFRQACGWPDRMGQIQDSRRSEHYINVPRHWSSIFQARCHEVPNCLFSAIRDDEAVLKSIDASLKEKLIALKFLGHWVGDIHQPLHVSFSDDRGGNEITLRNGLGCKLKLHDVWDNCIPEAQMKAMGVKSDRAEFGKRLHEEITPEQRNNWLSTMSPLDWANESLAIARQPDTQYCVLNGLRCDYTEDQQEYIANEHVPNDAKKELNLTSEYESRFGPVVKERLQRAGVRLGAILNGIFRD
jgi:hypothetical protein